MGDEPPGIIREHERGGDFGFGTGLASFAQAPHPYPKALFIMTMCLICFLLHQDSCR